MSEKYDDIGIGYNLTRNADPYLANRLYHHLNSKTDRLYLDIGCGTGNYTNALNKKGIQFIGIDPSLQMLKKAKLQNTAIKWIQGKAESIPIKDHSVDGCMASLTLHHWADLCLGFKELSRVLKHNGHLVIFTSTPQQMRGYWLNEYFPKMMKDSMGQMPTYETVGQNLTKNRFQIIATEKYFVKPELQDLFLYSGKHEPNKYLNSQIRNGISSFSALANKNEVEQGLLKLENDIQDNSIQTIINNYKNDDGDYLFVIAKSLI